MKDKLKNIRQLIALGKTELAIDALGELDIKHVGIVNSIQMISANSNELKSNLIKGVLKVDDASTQQAKINSSVMDVISRIESILEQSGNTREVPKQRRLIDPKHIDLLIKNQKGNLKIYLVFISVLILLAAVVKILGFKGILSPAESEIYYMILFLSLCGYSIHAAINKRNKIKTFEVISLQLESAGEFDIEEEDRQRLNEMVWNLLEKMAAKN